MIPMIQTNEDETPPDRLAAARAHYAALMAGNKNAWEATLAPDVHPTTKYYWWKEGADWIKSGARYAFHHYDPNQANKEKSWIFFERAQADGTKKLVHLHLFAKDGAWWVTNVSY